MRMHLESPYSRELNVEGHNQPTLLSIILVQNPEQASRPAAVKSFASFFLCPNITLSGVADGGTAKSA
jgi:hypothetical protein